MTNHAPITLQRVPAPDGAAASISAPERNGHAYSALITEYDERILPAEIQRVVQIFSDTYETLDLRIETTLGSAEADFMAAMPEIAEHAADVRLLVAMLMADLRAEIIASPTQPILLRFAYQDRGDLVDQLLSGNNAQVTIVPVDEGVALHAKMMGDAP